MIVETRDYVIKLLKELYNKFCKGEYCNWNKSRIDYVVEKVLLPQHSFNPIENKIIKEIKKLNVPYKCQEPIPILSQGGKLEHLYVADILLNDNIIIECDGSYHHDLELKAKDYLRDEETSSQGYITKRISCFDKLSIRKFIKEIKELLK